MSKINRYPTKSPIESIDWFIGFNELGKVRKFSPDAIQEYILSDYPIIEIHGHNAEAIAVNKDNILLSGNNTQQVLEAIDLVLNPAIDPTFTDPYVEALIGEGTQRLLVEANSLYSGLLMFIFNPGEILINGVMVNGRSGEPTSYDIMGTPFTGKEVSTDYAIVKELTDFVVPKGETKWDVVVNYGEGPQPQTSRGVDFESPLEAGATPSIFFSGESNLDDFISNEYEVLDIFDVYNFIKIGSQCYSVPELPPGTATDTDFDEVTDAEAGVQSTVLVGALCIYATISDISNLSKLPDLYDFFSDAGLTIPITLQPQIGADKQRFDIPLEYLALKPLVGVKTLDPFTNTYKYAGGSALDSLSEWAITDVMHDLNSVTSDFKRYTYLGADRNTTKIQLIF